MTVSAPGILNGLTALAHATTNCWPMILISKKYTREYGLFKLSECEPDSPKP